MTRSQGAGSAPPGTTRTALPWRRRLRACLAGAAAIFDLTGLPSYRHMRNINGPDSSPAEIRRVFAESAQCLREALDDFEGEGR